MSNLIYVMGVAPVNIQSTSTQVCIWGVTHSSMYGNTPYKRIYFEQFDIEGGPASQAIEVADASREFYPLALVLEQRLSPVAERIAFCIETHYIIPTFFRQTPAQIAVGISDIDDKLNDAARHVVTFLRRCREDTQLRDAAWGVPQTRTSPANGRTDRARRTLYSRYERANGRHTSEIVSRTHVWWQFNRKCSCEHHRIEHLHYRDGTDCSHCPCNRFQWRLFKWVY